MKEQLQKIRESKTITNKWNSILCSFLILLLGVGLGIFSKWLDNLALDSAIWWHRILERIDLRNVLSDFAIWLVLALGIAVFSHTPIKAGVNALVFFMGMCISYHVYTIVFSGFNPFRYMLIWYAITLFSPILAVICWYGKGEYIASIAIDILIVAILAVCCFSIGLFYFGFHGMVNALLFIAGLLILYSSPKQLIISGVGGMILSFLISPLIPF